MNKNITISTDSCCDEFKTVLTKKGIKYEALHYIVDGKEYADHFSKEEEYKAFYEVLKDKKNVTTSMINIDTMEKYFENIVKETKGDIVHISLSSGLSGSYSSAVTASKVVMEKYPDSKIYVIDSLAASHAQKLLVYFAEELKKQGLSAEEIAKLLEENKENYELWIAIGDLSHLKRGGRISSTQAILGSLLMTKPIITLNEEGKVSVKENVIGMRKAIKTLAGKFSKLGDILKEQVIQIAHCDCPDLAESLKKQIQKICPIADVIVDYVGPVVGCHVGPGTVGIAFRAKSQ